MYKFHRLGYMGYTHLANSMCAIAAEIGERLAGMYKDGIPRFQIISKGKVCLPVACALFNPDCPTKYNAVVLQNKILESGWFVSGYNTAMYCATDEQMVPLFANISASNSMFRIVVKANMSPSMANQLMETVACALEWLDTNFTSAGEPRELARGLC